jgi:PPOX class probable F420-dependent enzyme
MVRQFNGAYDSPMADAGFSIDESSEFGARAARHLREDRVVWFTTVSPSGAPSPNPVWFLWDGAATVLVWNLPTAARVAHLSSNPRVTLHFSGDGQGGDIVVLAAIATVDQTRPAPDAAAGYVAKYGDAMVTVSGSQAAFAATYSTPVVVTLSTLRGH